MSAPPIKSPRKKSPQKRVKISTPIGQPHFIKEWRNFRNLTQAQLADRLGMSTASVSQIENRKSQYTQMTLEGMANALQCAPADLLVRNPRDPDAIWSLWERAQGGERKQIVAIVEGYLKTRTGT